MKVYIIPLWRKYENSIFKAVKNKIKQIISFYAFDQSDGQFFIQKIWGTTSFFFSEIGPEVQATLNADTALNNKLTYLTKKISLHVSPIHLTSLEMSSFLARSNVRDQL